MDVKEAVARHLERIEPDAIALSHRIHGQPELGFAEHSASQWVTEALSRAGFSVTTGVAGLPTALAATTGSGDLTIGLFAEYDALPEIGHACGHNIIAAAAVTAGRLLAPLADDLGITVKVFGTPAEEGGGGKILMLDRGVFDGVHAAMMVHPAPEEQLTARTLAVAHLRVRYTGKTAHASAAPERGVNAADAFTVAQVAIGLLRQHIDPASRIHGVITRGGEAPNVVPGLTEGRFYVRSATLADLADLQRRVELCFEAGALATGCELSIEPESPPYSEFDSDGELETFYRANAETLGRRFPLEASTGPGSTDMANVSLAMPAIHPSIGLDCGAAVNHQPEFAAWCAEPTGDRAVLDAALAMAWTVIDVATSEDQRRRLLSLAQQGAGPHGS
ncbi:MAG TPA: M20 family metallopeptidase [Streptosporangiaceae bacterium]|nr:M20 family metallopeptidase [Streptosporangiaceae bacterium]